MPIERTIEIGLEELVSSRGLHLTGSEYCIMAAIGCWIRLQAMS
jgi:hypothetical protein